MHNFATVFSLFVFLLTSTILAFPTNFPAEIRPSLPNLRKRGFGPYNVYNYTSSCAPVGCVYSFNITYTSSTPVGNITSPGSSTGEPSFTTYCQGTDIQGSQRPCANPKITTNMVPGEWNATLIVQHTWTAPPTSRFMVESDMLVSDAFGPGAQGINSTMSPTSIWAISK